MNETRTELSQIGEFGLINRMANNLRLTQPSSLRGIGDDAAVIAANNTNTLISKELLIEGVHFDLSYFPLKHLGYKLITAGVSDILAMNGTPTQVLVGVGMSNRFSVEALDELYAGIKLACKAYEIDLVGGDTSASRSGLVLSVTALGTVESNRVAYRNTAKANDIICVTGDLGAAYLGLQVLEREKQVFLANPDMQPELSGKEYLIERQLKPEARSQWITRLRDLDVIPTAMIDVSDGLASELLHLCGQSGVGARIFEEHIPVDDLSHLTATELNISPITAALNGGEDYELLFTVGQADYEKLQSESHLSFIGFATASPQVVELMTKGGNLYPLTAQGFSGGVSA